ncbi:MULTISPECIES: LuxR C-terminal-related transcriptional regulator [Nocardioides]|uniref:LuxR C-terminal-related transcriptional regulator n=1 Tax=Nocardioides vastitatis TaxID=2568655 RepID=A0ABW0ZKP6_9ACTN|nr:LuxR C-terminal-related transcriptional regulator [Nocardioides sp.]
MQRPHANWIPRLPQHIVQQRRARALLDRRAPITVVLGHQGYGKTTLVNAWLREQPDRSEAIWLNARAGLDLTEMVSRTLDQRPKSDRTILVIDDAHHARDQTLLGELIERARCRHQLHLVLCSRGSHPIEPLADGVVETTTISARRLLLTVDQVLDFAAVLNVPLSTDQARRIHTELGGWAAAVRLVLEEIEDPGTELPLSRARHYLRDALLSGTSDTRALSAAMEFSLTERVTHVLIRDIADGDGPEDGVRLIESTGLAERQYVDDDVILTFPPFIREVLRAAFTRQRPARARSLHRRLAQWFATRQGPSHSALAFSHAAAGEDWQLLDEIWRRESTTLLFEHPHALASTIATIPEDVLDYRPGLSVAYDVSRAAAVADTDEDGRMVTVRAYIQATQRLSQQPPGQVPVHDLLVLGIGRIVGQRVDGCFTAADQAADDLERVVEERVAAGEEPGDGLHWLHLQRGITHTLRGEHAAAAHRYRLVWQHRGVATRHGAATATANLALTHALWGDPQSAQNWLDRRADLETGGSWMHALSSMGAQLAVGMSALDRLDLGACQEALNALGDGSTPTDLWPYVVYLRARHDLHRGPSSSALAVLDAAVGGHHPRLAQGGAARVLLARARADLLLAQGQGERARAVISGLDPEGSPMLAIPLVRLHLLAGDPFEAFRIAEILTWQATTDNRSRQELLVLAAVSAYRMGDHVLSADITRRALALYRHTRLLAPFTCVSDDELDRLFTGAGEWLDVGAIDTLRRHPNPFPERLTLIHLTPREQVLADTLASGASRQEIADQLFVSINTVRTQLAALYRKLNVNTREAALVQIAELGLSHAASAPKS